MNEGLPGWLDSSEPQGTTAPARYAPGTTGGLPPAAASRLIDLEEALAFCTATMRQYWASEEFGYWQAIILGERVLMGEGFAPLCPGEDISAEKTAQ